MSRTQQEFMLRRNPTKIELRQEDKEEVSEYQRSANEFLAGLTVELQPSASRQEVLLQFEALKQHQAQQEASGARQEAGAARAPERSTLQQQPKASTALHQSQGTSLLHSSPAKLALGSKATFVTGGEALLLNLHHLSVVLPAGSAERGCEDWSAEVMEVGLPPQAHRLQFCQFSLAACLQRPCIEMLQNLQQ